MHIHIEEKLSGPRNVEGAELIKKVIKEVTSN